MKPRKEIDLLDDSGKELTAVKDVYGALDKKFGKDIVVLDIRALSVIADYFVITEGSNVPQMQALALAAEEAMRKNGYRLLHSEGTESANWVLLDFGDIIVHLFDRENRGFYNLEHVWGDAKIVKV
jgi:ribosome-associated protein